MVDAVPDTPESERARGPGVNAGYRYRRAPSTGRIDGVYKQHLDRPSGRFAIIERQNDFTLVPWRKVLERNRGLSVTGQMGKGQISWTLTKGRGIGA